MMPALASPHREMVPPGRFELLCIKQAAGHLHLIPVDNQTDEGIRRQTSHARRSTSGSATECTVTFRVYAAFTLVLLIAIYDKLTGDPETVTFPSEYQKRPLALTGKLTRPKGDGPFPGSRAGPTSPYKLTALARGAKQTSAPMWMAVHPIVFVRPLCRKVGHDRRDGVVARGLDHSAGDSAWDENPLISISGCRSPLPVVRGEALAARRSPADSARRRGQVDSQPPMTTAGSVVKRDRLPPWQWKVERWPPSRTLTLFRRGSTSRRLTFSPHARLLSHPDRWYLDGKGMGLEGA
jgi:hypothetical protein